MATIDELMSIPAFATYYEAKIQTLPPYYGEGIFKPVKIATDVLSYLNQQQSAPKLTLASSYDSDPLPIQRDKFDKEAFQTSFFRTSMQFDETQLEELNRAQFNQDDALLNSLLAKIYDSQAQQLLNARARREWLAMSALINGAITLNGGGVTGTIQYKAGENMSADAKTSWADTAKSDPMADITSAVDAMKANGRQPNQIVMNTETFRQLQNNDNIKSSLYPASTKVNNVRLRQSDLVDLMFSEFKLAIIVDDQGYNGGQGAQYAFIPFIPTGKVVLVEAPMGDASFMVTGSDTTTIGMINSNNVIGQMAFAPTPEELGARSGRIQNLQLFDTGVAYHRVYDDKKAQSEDIVAMNVLPSFQGSTGVFRLNANPAASGSGNSSNSTPSNGK